MSQLFLYSTVEKILRVYSSKQIHDMTMDGLLDQTEFVYDFDKKEWVKIRDISIFIFLQVAFPDHGQREYERPASQPPPIEKDDKLEQAALEEIQLITSYFEKIKNKYSKLRQKNLELVDQASSKDKEIIELREKNDRNAANIKKSKENYKIVVQRYEELKDYAQTKRNQIGQQNEKIAKLTQKLQEGEKLRANYKKIDESYKGLEQKIKAYQDELSKNRKQIQKLQKANQQRTDQEVKRLTGESFELSNGKVWLYKKAGKQHGPMDFEEMLELKRLEKISEVTLLKNTDTETGWKALKDHFEFDAPFETIITEEQGKPVKRFFIKRNSIRVPIYDVMSLNIEGEEHRGYCTSLSLGGCFMEMTRLKEGQFNKGDEAGITLSGETFGTMVSAKVTIRNIGLSRPKGLGLMFNGLDEASHKVIEKYISESLNKMGS